jgi:Flp pilus assembly protein TadD
MLKRLQAILPNHGLAARPPGSETAGVTPAQTSQALRKLGNTCLAEGKLSDARTHYESAIAAQPGDADAHVALGFVLSRQSRWTEARRFLELAVRLEPENPEACYLLRVSQLHDEQLDRARDSLVRALALNPKFPEAHHSLGMLHRNAGRLDEALHCFDQALALSPGSSESRLGKALILLLRGEFAQGLELFESRLEHPTDPRVAAWLATLAGRPEKSLWAGERLKGRRLLVWVEEGLGDCLMMMRYLPMLKSRGIHAISVLSDPSLARLMRTLPIVEMVTSEVTPELFDAFDVHCPIMSLPRLFGTRADSIPGAVPYLALPHDMLARPFGNRHFSHETAGQLRVGLAWAGNRAFSKDHLRSLTLRQLQPLLEISGIRFVSLQKGDAAAEAATLGWPVFDCMDSCTDFLDTAALVAHMDLVISVDTAVAHLAGALGRPVWLFNRAGSEWRWQLNRDASPWYPTMRLFNQAAAGDWTEVVHRMAQDLKLLATGGAGAHSGSGPKSVC